MVFCKDCKHSRWRLGFMLIPTRRCAHQELRDKVSGRVVEECDIARIFPKLCGPNAQKFEQRKKAK